MKRRKRRPRPPRCRHCKERVDITHPMHNIFPDTLPGWCGKCCDHLAQAMSDLAP